MRINEQKLDDVVNEVIQKFIEKEAKHVCPVGCRISLMEYRIYERNHVSLVEERGIAAFEYREIIREIINIIKELIDDQNYHTFEFDLNCNGDNIDWARNFIIQVQFTKDNEEAEYIPSKTIIKNGVVEMIFIILYVNPFKHNPSLLSQYLFHELNHCKDDICRIQNNKPSLETITNDITSKIKYQQVYLDFSKNKDIIAYLIYYLFTDTELNAYVSQFYEELYRLNIPRNMYSKQFKNTDAYKRYDSFIYQIEKIEKTNGWEQHAMNYFNMKFSSTQLFRKWFLRKAKYKVSKFFKKLCNVADLYYITKETE